MDHSLEVKFNLDNFTIPQRQVVLVFAMNTIMGSFKKSKSGRHINIFPQYFQGVAICAKC
jgi:hypothetical protein